MQPMILVVSGIAFAAALVLAPPRTATACSAVLPELVSGRQVVPSDGNSSIPTNAQVVVGYQGGALVDHLQLRSSSGTVSTATATPIASRVSLTPIEPMQPNMRYQVLSEIAQIPCMTNAT